MRILITNNHLHTIGGTEMWTYTMCKELHNTGHSVQWFTLQKGIISDTLSAYGIGEKSYDSYDLILANHQTTIETLRGLGPIIQTCHGLLPLCMPHPYANYYVGVSPRVVKHCYQYIVDHLDRFATLHPHPPIFKVILNGIDCELYRPVNKLNSSLTTVLSLCQSEQANSMLDTACRKLGVRLITHNKSTNPQFGIYNAINDADLVVGWGRSLYDAMACGRPVVSFDIRNYASGGLGYIDQHNVSDGLWSNFTGLERYSIPMTTDSLITELNKYTQSDGEWCRNFALSNLNVTRQVQKYFDIAGVM